MERQSSASHSLTNSCEVLVLGVKVLWMNLAQIQGSEFKPWMFRQQKPCFPSLPSTSPLSGIPIVSTAAGMDSPGCLCGPSLRCTCLLSAGWSQPSYWLTWLRLDSVEGFFLSFSPKSSRSLSLSPPLHVSFGQFSKGAPSHYARWMGNSVQDHTGDPAGSNGDCRVSDTGSLPRAMSGPGALTLMALVNVTCATSRLDVAPKAWCPELQKVKLWADLLWAWCTQWGVHSLQSCLPSTPDPWGPGIPVQMAQISFPRHAWCHSPGSFLSRSQWVLWVEGVMGAGVMHKKAGVSTHMCMRPLMIWLRSSLHMHSAQAPMQAPVWEIPTLCWNTL
jgi:hypothetical protein